MALTVSPNLFAIVFLLTFFCRSFLQLAANLSVYVSFGCAMDSSGLEVERYGAEEHQEILARRVLQEIATVGTGADVPLDEYMYACNFECLRDSACSIFLGIAFINVRVFFSRLK